MDITTGLMMDFSSIEDMIINKLYESIGGIIAIIVTIIFLWILWYILQPEMKGECPYCDRTFMLRKRHQDKMCPMCNKEFRLRNMRIYKGEDVTDEFWYYMTKGFACLAALSGNSTDAQREYVEKCGIEQGLTRHQFKDMLGVYEKTLKHSTGLMNSYKNVIYHLRLYVEDYFSDRKMLEIENNDNNILSILYSFAMIDGKVNESEMMFFKYLKKTFKIDDDRFNLVVTDNYQTRRRVENNSNSKQNESSNNYYENEDNSESYKQRNTQNEYSTSNQEYYKILGCDSSISDEELKKQYKKMMMQYHPDKYASSALPEEIEKMLNEKMSELNEAYDKIKQERGIN